MNVLFGSVVYKSAEKYLSDFLTSLEEQSKKNFSLLLLNDDMDSKQLKRTMSGYSFETEIVNCSNKTPVQLRIELLKEAKLRETDLLILGDCDDYFSNTRVQAVINAYKNDSDNVFFYNELVGINGISLMPKMPENLCDFKEIGEYNFLGLSNSAININRLSLKFIDSLHEYQYEIFDWYLFSRMLLEGMCGVKAEGCNTVYRLHENNIAGISEINEINIKREISVKRKHYESLRKYQQYFLKKYCQYQRVDRLEILNKQDKHFWWNLLKYN